LLCFSVSIFQRATVSFPFCECKGTAFFRTTKQNLKKNDIFLHFSARTGQKLYNIEKKRKKSAIFGYTH